MKCAICGKDIDIDKALNANGKLICSDKCYHKAFVDSLLETPPHPPRQTGEIFVLKPKFTSD